MPQEKLLLPLEVDPIDSVPFPYISGAEVDRIAKIGDRAKDILLAKLGDNYSIEAVDSALFSWEIHHSDMSGVIGGYFYYAPTQVWTRTDCHQHFDLVLGTLVLNAPIEVRELVRTEVNQQLRAIKGSSDQGAIA